MPAISFSTMKDKLKNGEKTQTIRPKRSDYWLQYNEGDQLIGYWKQRSKGESKQLFKGVMSEDPFVISSKDFTQRLAIKDGFEDLRKMHKWFKDRYGWDYMDMKFIVIRWQ